MNNHEEIVAVTFRLSSGEQDRLNDLLLQLRTIRDRMAKERLRQELGRTIREIEDAYEFADESMGAKSLASVYFAAGVWRVDLMDDTRGARS